MKQKFLFISVICCIVLFSSCSKDENPESDIPESGELEGYDQQAYFQSAIVRIDSLGNFIERVNGAYLDPADTTALSMGVSDFEDAKNQFKNLLSFDTKYEETEDEILVTFSEQQGTVKLVKDNPEAGHVAKIVFNTSPAMKYVTSFTFVDKTFWNTNGVSPYMLGDIVNMESPPTEAKYGDKIHYKGLKKWVCIKEASAGKAGILVYISDKKINPRDLDYPVYAPAAQAQEVSKIFMTDSSKYVGFLESAGINLGKGEGLWYGEVEDWALFYKMNTIILDTKKCEWWNVGVFKDPKRRYLLTRTFNEF